MDPYLGEIRLFAGGYAPTGWAVCDGSLVSVQEYELLFSLLGTTYGGDGANTFGLPDLRGRIPLGLGQGSGLSSNVLGQKDGTETVALTAAQMPLHTHALNATSATADRATPGAGIFGTAQAGFYTPQQAGMNDRVLADAAVAPIGGSGGHTNLMPFQVVNYIICMSGLYPEFG